MIRWRSLALLVVLTLASGVAAAHPTTARADTAASSGAHMALVAGTPSGAILRADAGVAWRSRQTLDGPVRAFAAAPGGGSVFAATSANLWHSTDGGAHWSMIASASLIAAASWSALAVNPRNPSVVYAGSQYGVYQTTDGGAIWVALRNGPPSVMVGSLAVDPHDPASVWAGTDSDGLYHSTDGGSTWALVDASVLSGASVRDLAISPSSGDVIYAGTANGLYQSVDGGRSWVALDGGLPDGSTIDALAISPRQPSRVYAGTDTGVWVSSDGGSMWSQGGGDLPTATVSSLVADPANALVAYAGTDQGLYRTADGGASWSNWSGGDLGYDSSVSALVFSLVRPLPTDPAAPGCCGARYFPQTQHSLAGYFLAFWSRYGGLDTFGYPRSEPFVEGGRWVQYTDRFRLELAGSHVVTAPLGRVLTAGRAFPRVMPFPATSTSTYFTSTGHGLTGRFLRYWQTHNGAILLGAPIAEPTREANGDGTGRVYLVQWFVGGRLEYHPELAGTRYEVQIGLTGKQDLRRLRWLP